MKNSDNYVRRLGKKQRGFVIIDISSRKTSANLEGGLTSFTFQIELIFSLKMENLHLLKQIVNNTEPKKSFPIVVRDNKTRFKTWFKPPISLDKK